MLYSNDSIRIQEVTEDKIKMIVDECVFIINRGDTVSVLIDKRAGIPSCSSGVNLYHNVTLQELRESIVGSESGIRFSGKYAFMQGIGKE